MAAGMSIGRIGLAVLWLAYAQGVPSQPSSATTIPQAGQLEGIAKDLLQQYAAAYAALDADKVKKVQPSMDVDGLRKAFLQMRALEITIDNIRVLSSDGTIARVSCRVMQTMTPEGRVQAGASDGDTRVSVAEAGGSMGDRRVRTLIGIAVIVLAGARGAAAQAPNESSLSALLTELILRDITLPTPQAAGLSHSAHFSPFTAGELTNPAVSIVEGFNKQLLVQLSTFPIGSSAGGFSYQFDPALGTFKRASTSFGPLFAERAQTIGRGRLSGGFNYQHTRYDTFEGVNLDDGSIKFYLRHQECCTTGGNPVPPFFGVVETAGRHAIESLLRR